MRIVVGEWCGAEPEEGPVPRSLGVDSIVMVEFDLSWAVLVNGPC